MSQLRCCPNHKPPKSILVEFEFFTAKFIELLFYHLPKFGGETPTAKQNRTT